MQKFYEAIRFLKEEGSPTPELDAEVLLMHLTGCERYELYTKELDFDEKAFWDLVKSRAKGIPVAYLTGEKEFYGYLFKVGPGVLIPRPDSEAVVQKALDGLSRPGKVLDLCAGSGCLGLTVGLESGSEVTLVDDDPVALDYLAKNKDDLYPKARVVKSDLFENVKGSYDLIVSNPPYIDLKAYRDLPVSVKSEPEHALLAGDGLDFYRRILDQAPDYLVSGGRLIFEVGDNKQAKEIVRLCKRYLKDRLSLDTCFEDLSGKVRGIAFLKE